MSGDYTFPNVLVPIPEWTDIPQLEEDTPATGGAGMPANAQAQALANRIESLANFVYGQVQPLIISGDDSSAHPGVPMVYWDANQGLKARLDLSMYSAGAVVAMPTNIYDGDELILIVTSRTNFLAFDTGYQFAAGVDNPFFTSQSAGYSVSALFRFVYDQQHGILIGSVDITDPIPI